MKKLKIGDLQKIRDKVRRTTNLRESKARAKITVHMGTCGIASGSRDILIELLKEIDTQEMTDVLVNTSGCAGLCSQEPMVTVAIHGEPPVKYGNLTPAKIKKILNEHVTKGSIVEKYALAVGSERTH